MALAPSLAKYLISVVPQLAVSAPSPTARTWLASSHSWAAFVEPCRKLPHPGESRT